ncbi:S9 family peptidase [Hymenobacter busanensis]|uniref:S9 family peptidase n=1 Tax=Hymenobacter busanensis TaxID=2607656 RepID=A0A7L4ZVG7_9BACT|nr:S9 family peptidase [Hymenobacter busanensis]KAA9332451.1 S9 family peptidase [Hymenobacter busanensis]QHJ07211.1 prolyl oligopeptidase family serine peptidase [Hymenobacter busanensis]
MHSFSRRAALPVLLLALAGLPSVAQQKRLSMEDAYLNRSLQPTTLKQLTWIPGSKDEFSFARTENGQDELVRGAVGGSVKQVVSLATLSQALQAAGAPAVKASAFPTVQWTSPDAFVVTMPSREVFRYSTLDGKATKLFGYAAGAENVELDPTKTRVAYTKAQNLFISAAGKENVAVTTETNPAIVNGQAAHRSEFGITKGTFWSPKGNKLAYYRMDQTMVTDYPIVDVTEVPAQEKAIKYPMAGDKSHQVTVGVYDVASGQTVFLQTGEPKEQYLTNIAWSPDEKSVYVAVLNRDQNHLWLRQYDAASGALVKTLFEETDAEYVEPQHPLQFVPGHPDQFVWQSERSGYNHLYLYNTSGKLLKQLTSGNWLVTDVTGFDPKGKTVYFLSNQESPIQRQFYSVSLNGGKPRRLSPNAGTHAGFLSPSGTYLLDSFSSQTTPRTVSVLATKDGKPQQQLLSAPNPVAGYALGQMKLFPIKAADGQTDLYCRMITPVGFDPAKKYPAVVYVYGGPHVQLVTDSWLGGGNLWMQLMAEKGYVVFTVDSRGSGNRGLPFEQATFRQLGTQEMADQLKGVEYLKSLPYVDAQRIGVHGWSFGGFMTTTLLTRAPEGTFKVGVAGGPVIDWRMYEVMYTERYMDTPEQNPEGYQKANLLGYVQNLKTPLLLIHGTIDDVVVWQHSLTYLKNAVDNGVQLDYFVYPGHPHNVAGKDRVHLYTKITNYLDQYLKPEAAPAGASNGQ